MTKVGKPKLAKVCRRLLFITMSLCAFASQPAFGQLLTANCPQDDTCFSPLIGSNRNIYVNPGTYTFNNQVAINSIQNMEIQCAEGAKVTVPASGFSPTSLFLISGSSNIIFDGCELAGLLYTTGTISVTNASTSATLSTAPSATTQAAMANGWVTILGTAPSPGPWPGQRQHQFCSGREGV